MTRTPGYQGWALLGLLLLATAGAAAALEDDSPPASVAAEVERAPDTAAPAAAGAAAGIPLRPRRRHRGLPGQDAAGEAGAVGRLLRGRLLAAALGVPLRARGGAGCCSARGLSAQLRDLARRGHAAPAAGDGALLGHVPAARHPARYAALDLRRTTCASTTTASPPRRFGLWLGDQGKGLLVGLVMGALFLPLLYGILRRMPRTWALWGAVLGVVFMAFAALIAPVYINPLFNEYKKLADPKVLRADPLAGARQRHPGDRRLGVGRLAPDQPGLGQRQRPLRHRAHHPQRQPAEPLLAAGDRGGDGARDGALRAQSRLRDGARVRPGDRRRLRLRALGVGPGARPLGREVGARGGRRRGDAAAAGRRLLGLLLRR